MDEKNAWELFQKTGLPEMYSLYCALRDRGGEEVWRIPSSEESSCGKSIIKNQIKF